MTKDKQIDELIEWMEDNDMTTSAKAIKQLRQERDDLKSLAYHKDGISYRAMFTCVLGMGDEADELRKERDDLRDDLKLSQQHNREQARETSELKRWIAEAKLETARARKALKKEGDT